MLRHFFQWSSFGNSGVSGVTVGLAPHSVLHHFFQWHPIGSHFFQWEGDIVRFAPHSAVGHFLQRSLGARPFQTMCLVSASALRRSMMARTASKTARHSLGNHCWRHDHVEMHLCLLCDSQDPANRLASRHFLHRHSIKSGRSRHFWSLNEVTLAERGKQHTCCDDALVSRVAQHNILSLGLGAVAYQSLQAHCP